MTEKFYNLYSHNLKLSALSKKLSIWIIINIQRIHSRIRGLIIMRILVIHKLIFRKFRIWMIKMKNRKWASRMRFLMQRNYNFPSLVLWSRKVMFSNRNKEIARFFLKIKWSIKIRFQNQNPIAIILRAFWRQMSLIKKACFHSFLKYNIIQKQ